MRFKIKQPVPYDANKWRNRFAVLPVHVGYDADGNDVWLWLQWYKKRGGKFDDLFREYTAPGVYKNRLDKWTYGFPGS
jgi:hypothetical protein